MYFQHSIILYLFDIMHCVFSALFSETTYYFKVKRNPWWVVFSFKRGSQLKNWNQGAAPQELHAKLVPKRATLQVHAVLELHVPSMCMGLIKEHVHFCRWHSDLHYLHSTVCAKLLPCKTFRAFRIDSLRLHVLDHMEEWQLRLMVKFRLGICTICV